MDQPRYLIQHWTQEHLVRVIDRETGEIVLETRSAVTAADETFRLNHGAKEVTAA